MGKYFTAGEFAAIHGISKQTLLFYDKIGLIKPAYVDENNRYRYYSAKQMEVLDTISMLKEVGMPLAEIREYMDDRSVEGAILLLEKENEKLTEKIKKQRRINRRIKAKIAQLKEAAEISGTDKVRYEFQKRRYLYAEDVKEPFTLFDTDVAIKTLFEEASREKIEHNYQIGSIIPLKKILEGKYTEASKAYTVMEKTAESEHCLVVEEGVYAVFYHKGAYAETPSTYVKAIEEIKKDGYIISGDSFEDSIVDNLTAGNEKDYLTKISIPVKKMV